MKKFVAILTTAFLLCCTGNAVAITVIRTVSIDVENVKVISPGKANILTPDNLMTPSTQQNAIQNLADLLGALKDLVPGASIIAPVQNASNISEIASSTYTGNTSRDIENASARIKNKSGGDTKRAIGVLPSFITQSSGLQPIDLPKFDSSFYGRKISIEMGKRKKPEAEQPEESGSREAVFFDSTGTQTDVIPGGGFGNHSADEGIVTAVVYVEAERTYDPVTITEVTAGEEASFDTASGTELKLLVTAAEDVEEIVYTTRTFSPLVPESVRALLTSETGIADMKLFLPGAAKNGDWTLTTGETSYMQSWDLAEVCILPALTIQENGRYIAAISFDSTPEADHISLPKFYPSGITNGATDANIYVISGDNVYDLRVADNIGLIRSDTPAYIVFTASGDITRPLIALTAKNNDGLSWEYAYTIDSVGSFQSLMQYSAERYYKLNADIELNLNSIHRGEFVGHFDGQGHTVNIVDGNGLFESIRTRGTVPAVINLNLTGTGMLAENFYSGIIENCSFDVDTEAELDAGGIIAFMGGGTVRNCNVIATVTSHSGSAGGIVGKIDNSGTDSTCLILNCNVESASIKGVYSGGIAGEEKGDFFAITLSENSWPNTYKQVGLMNVVISSSDINPQETWNGHSYQVFNTSTTWEAAKSFCESVGAHLATITSLEEQNFIESLMRKSQLDNYAYWIGASADSSGWWTWVTDEVFEKQYRNFVDGQPNGSGNYLQIFAEVPPEYGAGYTFGGWDDTSGYVANGDVIIERGFICEWDEEQKKVEEAPLNLDFRIWQENPDEYKMEDEEYHYGVIPAPEDTSHLSGNTPKEDAVSDIPVHYDGRTAIELPEARNQGNFNTCWAFASIGAAEADYLARGLDVLGENPDLSELYVAWFGSIQEKEVDHDFLNSGGFSSIAENLLKGGNAFPVKESEMPYSVAGDGSGNTDSIVEAFLNGRGAGDFARSGIVLNDTKVLGLFRVETTDEAVKRNIKEHGAVYFHYVSDKNAYSSEYNSYYSANNDGEYHAALIVGWDDDFPASSFDRKPQSNGAWLVRNSWGKEWGENGYFWMSYEQADTDAGMSNGTVFIVSKDLTPSFPDEKGVVVYEHDKNGKAKNITPKWSANIFRSERNETLEQISFYTTDNNAKYKIFVNNFGKNKPTDPGDAEIPILSGDAPFMGYHRVSLPQAVELYSGDYYAVIVKMELNSGYEYPTGVETSIDRYITAYVGKGESFFAEGEPVPSVWQDGENIDGNAYNACIKAFTLPRITYDVAPSITTNELSEASEDEEYTFTLEASGTQPIEWRCGNIPTNFALSRQGIISGTPEEPGEYELKFIAFNNSGVTEKTLVLKVAKKEVLPSPEVVPTITTDKLDEALEGEEYRFSLEASGTQPIRWGCENIPQGLTLSEQGIISGIPEEPGEYALKFTAFNNAGTTEKTLILKVKKKEISPFPPYTSDDIEPKSDDLISGVSSSGKGCTSGTEIAYIVAGLLILIRKRGRP